MMHLIADQPTQADALLYPLTLTAQRAQYVSTSQPYLDVGYSMLVLRKPEQSSAFIFVAPYTGTAWLCILGALLATIVALVLTDGLTRHARLRAIERVHGARRAKRHHRKERAAEYALEATFMSLGAGSTPSSPSWSTRLVFIGWGIVSVILLATYTANLTAGLTVSQLATPFKTLDEMARDPLVRFGVVENGSIEAYFRSSSDRVARSLVDRMMLYPNNAACVGAVQDRRNDVYAAMLDYPVAVWWASQPPCDLALGADTFGPGALVLAFPRGSPLAAPLSAALMRLTDDGTMAELRRTWLSTAACGGSEGQGGTAEIAANPNSLGVGAIWGVFFLLALMVALAALYALCEVVYYGRFYKGKGGRTVLPRSAAAQRLRAVLTGTPSSLARHHGRGRDELGRRRDGAPARREPSAGGGSGGGGSRHGGSDAAASEAALAADDADVSLSREQLRDLRRQFGSQAGRRGEAQGEVAGGLAAARGGAPPSDAGSPRSASGSGARAPGSVRFSLGDDRGGGSAEVEAAAAEAGNDCPACAARAGGGGGRPRQTSPFAAEAAKPPAAPPTLNGTDVFYDDTASSSSTDPDSTDTSDDVGAADAAHDVPHDLENGAGGGGGGGGGGREGARGAANGGAGGGAGAGAGAGESVASLLRRLRRGAPRRR